MQLKNGEVEGVQTPVGIIPTEDELNLDGLKMDPAALATILSIDEDRWRQEIEFREKHLAQFDGLPDEIWAAHRRVAEALGS
jgi:phosphoenolpyruvate carboxykinase (GTP)